MKIAIKLILLIDDDAAANFLHRSILSKVCPAATVVTSENGATALEYLEALKRGEDALPELILLDINMPVMNGWAFLENYGRQEVSSSGTELYLMLTTPLTETDQARASSYKVITGFIKKPLSIATAVEKFS